LSSWSAHVQSWIVRPRSLVVRYEDFKTDPVKAFGTVVHFLGDDANPARLQKAIEFSGFDVVAKQEQAQGYQAHTPNAATAFFREGKAGAWREVLTAAQVAQIETDHGAMMRRLGYAAR
ncbi:MAG: sulfotransferase domain-containing protein, partial [Acidocella sp.]|nr:sulfotransferase domain-containing protein [Acidocella sp.]